MTVKRTLGYRNNWVKLTPYQIGTARMQVPYRTHENSRSTSIEVNVEKAKAIIEVLNAFIEDEEGDSE